MATPSTKTRRPAVPSGSAGVGTFVQSKYIISAKQPPTPMTALQWLLKKFLIVLAVMRSCPPRCKSAAAGVRRMLKHPKLECVDDTPTTCRRAYHGKPGAWLTRNGQIIMKTRSRTKSRKVQDGRQQCHSGRESRCWHTGGYCLRALKQLVDVEHFQPGELGGASLHHRARAWDEPAD
jgi:hypothetical protein